MKLVSWNVNGIRAALKKGLDTFVAEEQPDILCLQETKASEDQVEMDWLHAGYHRFWNAAERKGYSGTAVFTKKKPQSVALGMGIDKHDREGRLLALEFPKWHLVNVYTPNAQNELRRLAYRMQWDADFRIYLKKLEKTKPVIFCGDLNVAHQEIDLARPKNNRKNAGFTDEERAGFGNLVKAGFIDTFREFETGPEHYTWWSYRMNARAKNIGWRIDYWCVSSELRKIVRNSHILSEVLGSDHCPIVLELK